MANSQRTPSALGALGNLPFELRQDIYELLLFDDWRVSNILELVSTLSHFDLAPLLRSTRILYISKVMHREAVQTAFDRMHFHVDLICGEEFYMNDATMQSLDSIKNLDITLNIYEWAPNIADSGADKQSRSNALRTLCSTALEPFSGTSTLRNTCRIDIDTIWPEHESDHYEEEFDEVADTMLAFIEQLTGFRRVLVIGYTYDDFHPNVWKPEWHTVENRRMLGCFVDALEPTMGPAARKRISLGNGTCRESVEFFPRVSLKKKMA